MSARAAPEDRIGERLGGRLEERFGARAVSSARVRAGEPELPLVEPADLEELAELVRFAGHEGLALVPIGLASKLGWCRAPARADLLVSTRRLSGIVAHVPEDGTLSARAGTRLSDLREAARAGGHFLTPDVARPAAATLGGVLAAGESGWDRLRFGPARHHVLGMRVLLADGSLAKSGGQLVKNVTGYDLHRLYCGSHGSLCVIVEASLRLFPEPESELWSEVAARDSVHLLERARAALALPARIVTLCAERVHGEVGWKLCSRLFGKRGPLLAERASLEQAWPDTSTIEGADARRTAEERRDASLEREALPWLHVTCMPSGLPAVLSELESALARTRFETRWLAHPGVATVDVQLGAVEDGAEAAIAGLVRELRRNLARIPSVRVALRNAPSAALAESEPFGEAPRGLELMRALQDKLDPGGVFAAGRFQGGL